MSTKKVVDNMFISRLEPSKVPYGIMLIGINPSIHSSLKSAWEDGFGRSLISFLSEVDIKKEEIWLTNLYKFPTEDNRALSKEEIKEGWEELKDEIEECQPRCIIAMGKQVSDCFSGELYTTTKYKGITVYCVPHINHFQWVRSAVLRKKAINLLKKIKND